MVLEVKNLPARAGGMRLRFDPWVGKILLEEGMATHPSVIAWRNPMDRGAWCAIGSHRVEHSMHARTGDWAFELLPPFAKNCVIL